MTLLIIHILFLPMLIWLNMDMFLYISNQLLNCFSHLVYKKIYLWINPNLNRLNLSIFSYNTVRPVSYIKQKTINTAIEINADIVIIVKKVPKHVRIDSCFLINRLGFTA